jgi:putative ATP-binding cassette transporter
VIERLSGFDAAIDSAQALAHTPPVIEVQAGEGTAIAIEQLSVRLPSGVSLLAANAINVKAGERVLVTGPSGVGKSTLFRAIAGIWPFGAGTVKVPPGARVMMLPQRPYFPVATLAAALAYPAEPTTFGEQRLAEVVAAVGLPAMVPRLSEEAHWNHVLSLGEQQRLAIARAILQAPDFLFLDEATASLDELAEAALYRLIQVELAGATIVSIAHRATLRAFHRRHLALVREGERSELREAALEPAAE